MVEIKTEREIGLMREAGLVVGHTLAALREAVAPGVSTGDLDDLAEQRIRAAGAVPSFKGYHGYPATICASINNEIVHGIPSYRRPLAEGDLISIDCGAILAGWHGDSAITVAVGEVAPELVKLMEVTEDAMWAGIGAARTGGRVGDISAAIEAAIRPHGYGILRDYGVEFDVWTSEQRDVRDLHLPEKVLEELAARKLTYEGEGALWFRSSALGEEAGDDKDRVLRRSNGEVTYFAVDVAYHHYVKFRSADRVINLFGPDHHGYVPRMKAAMQALGHPPDAFEVLIVQLVTLLRDGQPVRMSKRRGEFVLMEELLEEVGRDAVRFTFLTRRHDSPLPFDLALATRQSAENPVYYVQYAHARIKSIDKQVAEQGIVVPPLGEVDLSPLRAGEELAIIKRLVQYPEVVKGAAHALEPHRLAYWLQELAGGFHPYYKTHRVIQDDRRLMHARLALCAGVGRVIRNGLELLGVSAPESM